MAYYWCAAVDPKAIWTEDEVTVEMGRSGSMRSSSSSRIVVVVVVFVVVAVVVK